MFIRTLRSVIFCATGNGDGIEVGFAIGDEMAIAHDKSAANTANAPIFALREGGMNVEFHEEDFSAAPVVASLAGFQKSELCSKSLLPISLMAPSGSLSMGL